MHTYTIVGGRDDGAIAQLENPLRDGTYVEIAVDGETWIWSVDGDKIRQVKKGRLRDFLPKEVMDEHSRKVGGKGTMYTTPDSETLPDA